MVGNVDFPLILNISPQVDRQGKNCFTASGTHLLLPPHAFRAKLSMTFAKLQTAEGQLFSRGHFPPNSIVPLSSGGAGKEITGKCGIPNLKP